MKKTCESELTASQFFFSSRRRHTRYWRDWSSDVCSSDLSGCSRVDGKADRGGRRGSSRSLLTGGARSEGDPRGPAAIRTRLQEPRTTWVPSLFRRSKAGQSSKQGISNGSQVSAKADIAGSENFFMMPSLILAI